MREYSLNYDEGLGRGLRPSAHTGRNLKWLAECVGALPEKGVLKAVEELPIPVAIAGAVWPYPQLFHLKLRTLVCTALNIYEYSSGSTTLVYTAGAEGTTWSVADFGEYLVLTNGQVVVERNPETGAYETDVVGKIPQGICVCSLGGQLLVGAPEVSVSAGFYRG